VVKITPFYIEKAEVLKIKLLGSHLVEAERHTYLISSWGVVTTHMLDGILDD
jgi:hypothetical protein